MAKFIINKSTSDMSGGIINSGAFIGFDTTFIWGTMDIKYSIVTYRSLEDYESGKSRIFIGEVSFRNYEVKKTMTNEEYASLNSNTNALVIVANWLKDKLIETGNFIDSDLTLTA